jgi:uncharacterized protein DUF3105
VRFQLGFAFALGLLLAPACAVVGSGGPDPYHGSSDASYHPIHPEAGGPDPWGDAQDAQNASEASDPPEAAAPDALADASDAPNPPPQPDASCLITIDSPPLLPALHVMIGSAIQWNSNPPSSGEHYPIWAAYQAYTTPVPRGYYVHNLEHGAIVLLYHCGDGGCPDVVAALQAASDVIPDDPLCAGQGVRVRTVITPDPLIDVPIAAAAWGWTYQAQCIDPATLKRFAIDHYGQGPEALCGNGTSLF